MEIIPHNKPQSILHNRSKSLPTHPFVQPLVYLINFKLIKFCFKSSLVNLVIMVKLSRSLSGKCQDQPRGQCTVRLLMAVWPRWHEMVCDDPDVMGSKSCQLGWGTLSVKVRQSKHYQLADFPPKQLTYCAIMQQGLGVQVFTCIVQTYPQHSFRIVLYRIVSEIEVG